MKRMTHSLAIVGAALSTPLWAVSLPVGVTPQPLPEQSLADNQAPPTSLYAIHRITAGSASLVPLMATEMEAYHLSQVDAAAEGGGGKSVDDISFVRQATESGRKEVASARDALPQLKRPELKAIAEMLVADHSGANARLSKIAEAKGWPVPAPRAAAQPDSGTASPDFDGKWTEEMIAGHERSVALYRAQLTGGEDADLRKFARETLPTIERHLVQLKQLQK